MFKRSLSLCSLAALFTHLPTGVDAQISTGTNDSLIQNSDASLDTDNDNRWEDLVQGSGLEFLMSVGAGGNQGVTIGNATGSLPTITQSWSMPGSGVEITATGQNGGQLVDQGTTTIRGYQNMNASFVGPDIDMTNERMTLELWFKPDDLTGNEVLWEDGGGTGLGLFLADNILHVRKQPGGYTSTGFDMSTLTSPTGEFTQAVFSFDPTQTNDTINFWVNGVAVVLDDDTGNNGGDWSGGDPVGLGTRGAANMGGIGGGSSGQASFGGEIAIYRIYRDDVLNAQQVARNYSLIGGQAVAGQNITFFDGSTDTTWEDATNWDTGVLPVNTDSMTVINGGSTVTVNAAGAVAHTLLVGSDINGGGTTAGAGTLNIVAGDLDVTTNLNLGGRGSGNVGTATNSGGTLTVQGDLNFDVLGSDNTTNQFTNSGGTTTITGNVNFDPANLLNPGGGLGGGGILDITSGTFTTGSVTTSGTGTSTLNLSGGSLVFSEGQVSARNVGTLNQSGTSDIEFQLTTPSGFTPLSVSGTATTANTSTITIATSANPVADPVFETTANNGIAWVAATASDWSNGSPDGVSAVAVGDEIDLIAAGTLAGTLPTSPDGNWLITTSGSTIIARRQGEALDLASTHAVITAVSGTITRATDLNIAEAPALIGADAARLSVRGTGAVLDITGGNDLIIGNNGGAGVATVGVAGSGDNPDLNVSGDVVFGSAAGDFGGEFAVDEGTADITGNLFKADPAVGDSTVSISGGDLTFDSSIDVDFLILGNKQDRAGVHTLGAGESINASQRMIVGNVGSGSFTNNGGTVTANQLVIGVADNGTGEGSADNSTYVQESGSTVISGFTRLGDGLINSADGAFLHIKGGTFTTTGGLAAAFGTNSGQTERSTIQVGGVGLNPVLTVSGGNLETANNHLGQFDLDDGTVFLNSNNLIIGQGNASNSVTTLSGGVMDLRGTAGTRTDADVNFNNGNGILTISGADVYFSRDIQMGSYNSTGNRTNRLNLSSGNLYVRDDIRTRNNGTNANGDKTDVINITGGNLIFGEGFAAGSDDDGSGLFTANTLLFEANAGQAGVNTFNVFDWSGGTIRGLDFVKGLANLTGSNSGDPVNDVTDAGIFRQKGGTFVVEGGTTIIDGNYAVDAGATIQSIFTADDSLANTPNPTPNRAIFIDPDGDETVLTGNGETITFADGFTLNIQGSGGAGDTSGGNAVTFDAGTNLTWDGTANNWTTDTLPAEAASGVVANIGDEFVVAESSEASLVIDPTMVTLIDPDWTLSLGDNDPNTLGLTNNQLIATRTTAPLNGIAASLAIIDGTAGGIVQRNTDLLLSTEAGVGADAAALQVDAQGLNLAGSANLIIGSGSGASAGPSFVNQNGGAVTVGGDILFGGSSGQQGGEYNLTGGTLTVTGNVVRNTTGENADLNFDGGTATFGGTVAVEDLGIGRKAGSVGTLTLTNQVIDVDDDVIVGGAATADGTLTVLGSSSFGPSVDDLIVGQDGTGVAILGSNAGGTQPNLALNRFDVGLNNGSDGTLTILDGTYSTSGGSAGFIVATNAGSTGDVIFGDGTTSPTINVANGNTETANAGTGSITINSGTWNQNTNNIIVGQAGTSDATFTVNGGEVNIVNQLRISNTGAGLVEITGGTVNVGGLVDMGNNAGNNGGTLNLSGGVLNANNGLTIGNNGTFNNPSAVSLSGGDLNVTGTTIIGNNGKGTLEITGVAGGQQHTLGNVIAANTTNANSEGDFIVNLPNAGDTVNVGAVTIGRGGKSSFTLTEGTVVTTGAFLSSDNAASTGARASTLTMGNGTSSPTLTVGAGNTELGRSGESTFILNSGTINQETSNFIVGQFAGSTGTFTQNNGDVDVKGGNLRVGNFDGSVGTYNLNNGTMIANAIDFGANSPDATPVSNLNMAGGQLTSRNTMTLSRGTTTLNFTGGTLAATTLNLSAGAAATDTSSTTFDGTSVINLSADLNYRAGTSDVIIQGTADVNIGGNLLLNEGGVATTDPSQLLIRGNGATIDVGGNFTMTGTNERFLSFEALSATIDPVSTIEVMGDVAAGGTLELLNWATIFSTADGFDNILLIDNQGSNPIGGTFLQTDGSVWNEGDEWINTFGDGSTWTLTYEGGTGNDLVLQSSIIPEPSRALLSLIGLGLVLLRRRRNG